MLFYLAWKNVISKKSSFVIVLFIAFAITMLVVTNSIFDSTENGVQETFVNSFTSDVVIRPKSENPLSLFGDETPVTGKLSNIPTLNSFDDLMKYLEAEESIEKRVPQLSGRSLMRSPSTDTVTYVFGVNASSYLDVMNSIKIQEGNIWENGEKGAMITQKYADYLGVKVGDILDFIVESGLSSRIRAVPVTAIYNYTVDNPTLEKIVLVNPETVRSLFDISELFSSEDVKLSADKEALLNISEDDFDSLFFYSSDTNGSIIEDEIEFSEEELEAVSKIYTESTSWNFIICKLKDSKKSSEVIKKFNNYFKSKNWNVEAINWRKAAGNTAFYLFILRFVLNIGIIIILMSGFIVINNTLIVNVLDRIREIGTMRAIGANKRYISLECMLETFIMSIMAGVIGCIFGIICSFIVTKLHITFSNDFLIQLFGGNTLVTKITFLNIFGSLILSIFIGLFSWILPVLTALRINPVKAMQGAK